jgi:proline iminopeptidase
VLHVVEVGTGRVTIIVLHGGPGLSHQYLRPEWETLGRRYRMVFYDQRGCGRSERRGPHHWEQHVADLHTLALRYRGQGPVVLAGSSWGSWLALLYAWRHPDQAAALVLSGLPPWPISGRQDHDPPARSSRHSGTHDSVPQNIRERWEALEAARKAYQDALEVWMSARQDSMEAGLLTEPTWDSLTSLRDAGNLDPGLAARFGESCPGARRAAHTSFLRRAPKLQDLKTITTPMLILRGTRPNPVGDGAVEVMRVLPARMLVTLMGAGHDPWYERPRQFFAHVERFLRRTIVLPTS